jgi:amidase
MAERNDHDGYMPPGPVTHWTATELSAAIARREVSCVEVMTAYLDHIDRINPAVNAIVSRRPREDLLAEAAERDRTGEPRGVLHGFPYAVKDLADVAGLPTSYGFAEAPPSTVDSLFVERIRAAGVIFLGKTNTPEFGLGSHTYNTVFGTTRNAYDQSRSAGGSSGGAAVAVALRMLPVADGSDFMGSLRNPPGWNNVLGLRPSFGRVPDSGGDAFVAQAGVVGPIARNAADLRLLLDVMSGYDPRAPLSIPDGEWLTGPRRNRVAWLGDLGGYLPMEPDVLAVTTAALETLTRLGMEVTALDGLPASGTFRGVEDLWPTWLTFRHWLAGMAVKPAYDNPVLRAAMKPEAVFEIEGLLAGTDGAGPISAVDVYRASTARTDLYHAFRRLFETYEYAVLPTAQVMPFDADLTWPREIGGVGMSSYHRWMEVTTIATLINAPAIALPAGFNADGLPIGLQVIARNHGEESLLALAEAWSQATGCELTVPPLLRS